MPKNRNTSGAYHQGHAHGQNRTYRPPGGTGWVQTIQNCVAGPSQPRKAYDTGYRQGRKG